MAFTVTEVANFSDSFAAATGGDLGTTDSLTAGRAARILIRTKCSGSLATPATVKIGGVSGQAATQVGAVLTNGDYQWSLWKIDSLANSGAQLMHVTFDQGTDIIVGGWMAEIQTDTGTVTDGAQKRTTGDGDDSITTTEANSLLFAFARAAYVDPVVDNLGGGTIVQATMTDAYNLNGGAWTLNAGAVGAKTISYTNTILENFAFEITTGGGGAGGLLLRRRR
jgi:hypothetical protein